jgi:hypothetical protein
LSSVAVCLSSTYQLILIPYRFSASELEDGEALLIQKLRCPFNRPKLLFGIDREQDVIRVSSENFTGFDRLAAGIVNIATGRERGGWQYPVFSGHIGARIPRMRMEVRDLVRKMRSNFKVVETGYFLNELEKAGMHNPDDVSDALHFLTNIGEISYFGEVISSAQRSTQREHTESSTEVSAITPFVSSKVIHEDESSICTHDNKNHLQSSVSSSTPTSTRHMSGSSLESSKPPGFDEFIFLNPRWLVAAVAW